MKKGIIIILSCIVIASTTFAQPPQAIKYQAVVRNATGDIISNETIDVQISILDGWAVGPVIYQETHSVSTNQFGLINLSIGWGTPGTGYNFQDIDWSLNEKFIEVEIWDDAGSTWISMGTSMLFSVPYSLYSGDDGDWITVGNNILAANSGNVGIGSTSLFYKLNVSPGLGSAIKGESQDGIGISGTSSGFQQAGIYGVGGTADSYGVYGWNWFGGDAIRGFSNGGWAGYFTGDLYTSGNVGFGTTTPNAKLHVNDRIRIGEDPSYSTVYGELIHEGGGNGFKINAHAGGGSWADMHLQTNGTTKMFIESSGKVGIGTDSPIRKLQVNSTGSLDAIQGWSPDGTGVYAVSASSYGIFGQSTSGWAGYFSGNVNVTGSLSKGGGSFVIDHPLDPENKLLRHNFVESPENLLIYRGKIQLDDKGEAQVGLPDYFIALTKEDEATIQLTPIGKPLSEKRFEFSYEWLTNFDSFNVYGEPGRQISWMVLADRDDPVIHELGRPVEEEKGVDNILCEKGKLLYPEAYGYPESMGRDYEIKQFNK